jgi:phospholipid/cholesterol/gamma-HCH transport system substrate-binding protein
MAGKADDQLFGPDGLMRDVSASLRQLAALLGQARASWLKVDALLVDAQAVAANTRGASTDLGALRTEVDTSLRKIQQLLDEVNRKWPFARDTDLRLP